MTPQDPTEDNLELTLERYDEIVRLIADTGVSAAEAAVNVAAWCKAWEAVGPAVANLKKEGVD